MDVQPRWKRTAEVGTLTKMYWGCNYLNASEFLKSKRNSDAQNKAAKNLGACLLVNMIQRVFKLLWHLA